MRFAHNFRLLCAFLVAAALPFVTAAPTLAGTSAPGVNLRWDACYGDGGAWNKNFACNTNSGINRLVGSFELAAPATNVASIEAYIDIATATTSLPAWWEFRNAGTCRQLALGASGTPTIPTSACVDWSAGTASGGMGAYANGDGQNYRRVAMVWGVPTGTSFSLNAGQEYFAFELAITHTKTVGTGSCAGCLEPACIFFSGARVFPNFGIDKISLTRGANYLGSQYATWQNGYPINVITGTCRGTSGGFGLCPVMATAFNCVLSTPTNSHGSTWGAVKALYR